MSLRELRQASVHVLEGQSLVIPLMVEELTESIETLGRRWHRKRAVKARIGNDRRSNSDCNDTSSWEQANPGAPNVPSKAPGKPHKTDRKREKYGDNCEKEDKACRHLTRIS